MKDYEKMETYDGRYKILPIVTNTVFDALSIGGGLVAAVALRIIPGRLF